MRSIRKVCSRCSPSRTSSRCPARPRAFSRAASSRFRSRRHNGAITVEFKQFGVKLDFTPTVLDEKRISLKVRPEVSEIDSTNSVTPSSIKIPGLTVRRVDTTVELASGQSFAIGGLLQSKTSDIVSQVPGLGWMPVLGKLFSSKNYQNNKTELVVIVTPYIVKPTDPGNCVSRSTASRRRAMSNTAPALGGIEPSGDPPRLVGAAGYVY